MTIDFNQIKSVHKNGHKITMIAKNGIVLWNIDNEIPEEIIPSGSSTANRIQEFNNGQSIWWG